MSDETETSPELRAYGPGKFLTILDSYVYAVSLEGGCDMEAGSVSETGLWAGFMRHGHTIFRDSDPTLATLTEAEQDHLLESDAVILTEDSQGFVAVSYYADMADADRDWDAIEIEADGT